MPHNHQCYTLGNHCAEFHPIPSVGRNQCKFPIPCKSPFRIFSFLGFLFSVKTIKESPQIHDIEFTVDLNCNLYHIFMSVKVEK